MVMERSTQRARIDQDPDRLSELPSDIVNNILSLLTTKSAVMTSILSKRWRDAWTTCPTLIFYQQDFHTSAGFNARNLIKFVDRVLALRPHTDLTTFNILWHHYVDMDYVNTWLHCALRCNVQHISVEVAGINNLRLPAKIFTCKTLRSLRLIVPFTAFRPSLELPASTNLSNLRFLCLSWMRCPGPLLGKLISGCPLLKHLGLHSWIGELEISAPNLTHLKLYNDYSYQSTVLRVSTPKLESFDFIVSAVLPVIAMETLQVVNKVRLVRYGKLEGNENGNRFLNLLRCVCKAKILVLDRDILKELLKLDWSNQKLPLFCNLRCLTIDAQLTADIIRIIVTVFLQNSPCLEKLVLGPPKSRSPPLHATGSEDDCIPWISNDACSALSKLKCVVFTCFFGDKAEFHLVKLLLEKGHSLEAINISCSQTLNVQTINTISKQLLAIPRASSSAKIYL